MKYKMKFISHGFHYNIIMKSALVNSIATTAKLIGHKSIASTNRYVNNINISEKIVPKNIKILIFIKKHKRCGR